MGGRMRTVSAAKWTLVALVLLGGCTRNRYRTAADAETYAVLEQKIAGRPWQPPGFTIQVDPRSRMFDPTNPNAPTLPYPGPRLYAYQLPPLISQGAGQRPATEEVPAPGETLPPPIDGMGRSHTADVVQNQTRAPQPRAQAAQPQTRHNAAMVNVGIAAFPHQVRRIPSVNVPAAQPQGPAGGTHRLVVSRPVTSGATRLPPITMAPTRPGEVQPASFNAMAAAQNQPLPNQPAVPQPPEGGERVGVVPIEPQADQAALPVIRISPATWESIPQQYLARMLKFESVRQEYQRTYGVPPEEGDTGERLSLEEIVEAGLINSREYQTEKEVLYRAALALTLERFDYAIKFTPFGNGVDLDYTHQRTNGITENRLGIGSQLQLNKMLASGGTIIGTFANNVLLTFNGPQGFNANIGSDLIVEITQPLLQRDMLFEDLTFAERNVVYRAREYARFRKEFFVGLSDSYYNLLSNYRSIEIDTQNYFSLSRAHDQAEAELLAGLQSRIQVEQIEQRMLDGRSRLISDFVRVEGLLDQLKIDMGLPTEYPLDLDLSELFDVSLRDEVAVTGEVVRRARGRLLLERQEAMPDRGELVNAGATLSQRLREWIELQSRLGEEAVNREVLEDLDARLGVDKARLDATTDRRILQDDLKSGQAPPIRLFQRTMDAIDSELELINRLLDLAARAGNGDVAAARMHWRELRAAAAQLRQRLSTALEQARLEEIPGLLVDSQQLLTAVDAALGAADRQAGGTGDPLGQGEDLSRVLEQTDELLRIADQLLTATRTGLTPVEMEVDDAMLTALTLRLDLMNQRGFLADDRRAVKLASDDLRSVLNLNAIQVISTERNRPFGFTFDNSRTDLGLTFDLPLNRKEQRNFFRSELINYSAGLRSLMLLEDNIKLAVRNDLRTLSLQRVQYEINVASAALATERVLNSQLELALGFPGVQVRDFLEAQDALRQARSAVADLHLSYIQNRAQFFFNLELMEVDALNFWRQLRDEQYQPQPQFLPPPRSGPAYGELPPFLWYSREIRSLHPN